MRGVPAGPVRAWFWGGPLDGQTRVFQRFHPEYLIPMPERLVSVEWGVRFMPIRVGRYVAEYKFYNGPEQVLVMTWKGAS